MTALPVLVIDDEPVILRIFERVLQKKDIPFDLAESTAKGIDFINSRQYGLIFTDLNQEPTGIDVFLYARNKGIETYIMTGGTDDPGLLEMAREVAADHLLIKPFELKDLLEILERYKQP